MSFNPLYVGLLHYYMLDESICHYRGVVNIQLNTIKILNLSATVLNNNSMAYIHTQDFTSLL